MASSDLNIGPSDPVKPVTTTRALARVTPVLPQPLVAPVGPPLGRSGLSTSDLLSAPDLIVVRTKTPALALEMGLEHARGALVRNQPTDALIALDEVWEGARNTETGWYLRGGSLALLGLPGEASRVANQVLDLQPGSVANRYLLSLTKLVQGDLPAAQGALLDATRRRPGDPLLLVQEALLTARYGNRNEAVEKLNAAASQFPDHSAVLYGRALMKQAVLEGVRAFNDVSPGTFKGSRTPRAGSVIDSIDAPEVRDIEPGASGPVAGTNLVTETLSRIGARVALLSAEEVAAECRALLVGLSAGGSLAASISPTRAYSVRVVVGALLDVMQNGTFERGHGWEAQSVDGQWQRVPATASSDSQTSGVLRATVRALVVAMRDGTPTEIEAIMRRLDPAIDDTKRDLLREFAGLPRPGVLTPGSSRTLDTEAMLLPALRLGLGLLPPDDTGTVIRSRESRGDSGVQYAVAADRTWAVSSMMPSRTRGDEGGGMSLLGAFALVVGAVLAFSTSHGLLSLACIAGVGWIALRQGSTQRDRRRGGANSPRGEPQD